MTTDKELLELAARAAGINGYWDGGTFVAADYGTHNPFLPCSSWNPLTNDGDALRLEVDTNITTKHIFLEILAEENALCNGDYRKARRRAIVRAAAEIGKAMK